MCDSPSPKVTIRLELVVEGGEARVILDKEKFLRKKKRVTSGCSITSPVQSTPASPKNTTVTYTGGKYCIAANGTASGGSGNCKVYALAYPDPALSSVPLHPPAGAVSTTASGGMWSIASIPGSGHDSINLNPYNNSTLVVWCECPSGSGAFSRATTPYHGYLASGMGVLPPAIPDADTLTATFTGALSGLGSVVLKRGEGGGWSASSEGGKAEVHFLLLGRALRLLFSGPPGTVLADGKMTCDSPFQWTGYGDAGSNGAGTFEVTVSE